MHLQTAGEYFDGLLNLFLEHGQALDVGNLVADRADDHQNIGWRGEKRGKPAPKRSMPQHAVTNGYWKIEHLRVEWSRSRPYKYRSTALRNLKRKPATASQW